MKSIKELLDKIKLVAISEGADFNMYELPDYKVATHFRVILVQQFVQEDGSTYIEEVAHYQIREGADQIFWRLVQYNDQKIDHRVNRTTLLGDFNRKQDAYLIHDFITKGLKMIRLQEEINKLKSQLDIS